MGNPYPVVIGGRYQYSDATVIILNADEKQLTVTMRDAAGREVVRHTIRPKR